MEMQKLIERTQNWGMTKNPDGSVTYSSKISLEGALNNLIETGGENSFGMKESVRFFYIAKEAWLKGDLETVADYFGILK